VLPALLVARGLMGAASAAAMPAVTATSAQLVPAAERASAVAAAYSAFNIGEGLCVCMLTVYLGPKLHRCV
jgi:MFS family permease